MFAAILHTPDSVHEQIGCCAALVAAATGGAAAGAAAGGGLNGHGVAAVHGRVDDGINMADHGFALFLAVL